MIDQIVALDKELMVFLNMSGHHSTFGDTTMWLATQMLMWLPVHLTLLYVIVKEKQKESILIIGAAILTIVLCDQTSSGILKPLVARLRPSHDPSIMEQLSYVCDFRAGTYGFPSSHAANCFGLALFLSLLLRNKAVAASLFVWAIICAYSRLYLGVHYPGDILVGIIIGLLSGYLCYKLYSRVRQKKRFTKLTTAKEISKNGSHLVTASIWLTIWCIVFCGMQASRMLG